MATHQATEQMLGYLYQVRYALNLLLNNDNENHLISIERFDDVAFSEDDSPKQMIQLKHHVRQHGNLSDASTDIWRTLKVWIDAIVVNENLLTDANFLIITTANAPEGSAASLLRAKGRDEKQAYYRAFRQRANWIRNDLLYVNELEKYEQRLVDEWEHHFASMEDKLNVLEPNITEQDKVKHGQSLLSDIEALDIRIRPKVQDAFVMRGSFHILANQLTIGWHMDFQERLKQLILLPKGGTPHAQLEPTDT